MISLYQYIVEKRGLLRDEWNYDKLIRIIIDTLLDGGLNSYNFLHQMYLKMGYESFMLDESVSDEWKKYLPNWISKLQLEIIYPELNNKDTNGLLYNELVEFEDGKISVIIGLNLDKIVSQHSKRVLNHKLPTGETVEKDDVCPPIYFKKLCTSTLQHELKHAFDIWLQHTKMVRAIHPMYFELEKEINDANNINGLWKDLFNRITYGFLKTEMSAHQQQYLNFYENEPIGISMKTLLKDKYGDCARFLDKIENTYYKSFHYDLMSEFIKTYPQFENEYDIVSSLCYNRYLELYTKLSNAINQIEYINNDELESIYQMCVKCYRYATGKTNQNPNKAAAIETMLLVMQNMIYKYLSTQIFKRVLK